MVKMGRYGVYTTSEIHIVREENLFYILEASCDWETKKELTSKSMGFPIFLMLFKKLKFFSEICIFNHLWCDSSLIEPLGDLTETTSNTPYVFYDFKDLSVNSPFNLAQDV